MHCTTLYNFFFFQNIVYPSLFCLFFYILQNPVHLVSALKLGDILIIGEKIRREERERNRWMREEKRSCPVLLLPSVKTLHSVPRLSSVPHLNLKENRRINHSHRNEASCMTL